MTNERETEIDVEADEQVAVKRREMFGAFGALGALAGFGTLAGCAPGSTRDSTGVAAQNLYGSSLQWVDDIAALQAIVSPSGMVLVQGYYEPSDGGGGLFWWDSASTETPNPGTLIPTTYSMPPAGRWRRVFDTNGPVSVRWFGAKGDGSTDDSDAIDHAFNAMPAGASTELFFPKGNYRISRSIQPQRTCVIRGVGGHVDAPATVIQPDDGVVGIIIDGGTDGPMQPWLSEPNASGLTAPSELRMPGTRCTGSLIEGLWILYSVTENTAPGIVVQDQCVIRRVRIENPRGAGLFVYGNAMGYGCNASGSHFEDVFITMTGGHGMHVQGPDANACVSLNVHFTNVGYAPLRPSEDSAETPYYGVYDISMLGNSWLACMFHGCPCAYDAESHPGGPFMATEGNTRTMFRDCYVEDDCGPPLVTGFNRIVDGLGAIATQDSRYQVTGGHTLPNFYDVRRVAPSGPNVRVDVNPDEGKGGFLGFTTGTTALGQLTIQSDPAIPGVALGGEWLSLLRDADLPTYPHLMLPLDGATIELLDPAHAAVPMHAPVFPYGLCIGSVSSLDVPVLRGTRIIATDSEPTAGTFLKGTIAINNWVDDPFPAADAWRGGLMYLCTQSGTYGTMTEPTWVQVVSLPSP